MFCLASDRKIRKLFYDHVNTDWLKSKMVLNIFRNIYIHLTSDKNPNPEIIMNELKNNLFAYISGGIKSPTFLTNNVYKNETKKISISYINLENVYKKKEDFLDKEVSKFIEENKDTLKEKNISFNYSKITPQNLIGTNEYNEIFMNNQINEWVDKIDNEIIFKFIKKCKNLCFFIINIINPIYFF